MSLNKNRSVPSPKNRQLFKVTRLDTVTLPKAEGQLCIYYLRTRKAVLIYDYLLYIILKVIVLLFYQYSMIKYPFLFPIAYGGGGGGGFLACAIRLSAITLEPFHLGSPNFLTSLFYLDTLWRNFR